MPCCRWRIASSCSRSRSSGSANSSTPTAAGGEIGSWWRVVGIGFLSLIVVALIFTALTFVLVYAGVVE
jgi:hypothetical protein